MSDIDVFELSSGAEPVGKPPLLEDEEYDRFLEELWVGIALALLVLSYVGCLCTAFLFHAFKQWQRRVSENQHVEAGCYDTESLPSYTVVAGLPSYEEAIEQLKQCSQEGDASPSSPHTPSNFSRLSVGDLLEIYKVKTEKSLLCARVSFGVMGKLFLQ